MQCAGADQRVHVQVLPEILAPGVQHQGSGDLPTEPTRILAELEQRVGGGLEQEAVDRSRIGLCQHIQRVRQGEHQVEVRHRQQLGPPGSQPTFLGQRLALRAMPVAAGVVAVT